MGHRTSIYLSDELDEAWRASGVPLSELVRRGLGMGVQVDEATLRRVLAEMLPPGGYATRSGTGTAEVPHTADMPHTAPSGTTATTSGTAAPSPARKAAREAKASRRAEPTADAAPASLSLPDLAAPLTVASALPKPARCTHPGYRVTGGPCPVCGPVKPGGLLRAQ